MAPKNSPNADVVHGDALAFLADMPADQADAIVADPPYSSGGAFRSDRAGSAKKKYLTNESAIARLPEFYGDNRTERGLLLWCSLWLGEAWRVTRPGGAIAVFCDWRSLPAFSDAIQAGGWSWRGVGVWTKPRHKSRPTLGGLWNDTEFILWGSKGPRLAGECLPGSWAHPAPDSSTRLHPTEKPQAVLRDLVRLAPSDGLVIDPFAGSGSTGVAAVSQGRRFVGCEISAEYAAMAKRRIVAAVKTGVDVAGEQPSIFEAAT